MDKKNDLTPNERRLDFYESMNISTSTINNYRAALQSSFLFKFLKNEFSECDLFEIVDIGKLWQIYSRVNLLPQNIKLHRVYSAAIMKYIRYLNNGNKLGKRIDYGKPRKTSVSTIHRKTSNIMVSN